MARKIVPLQSDQTEGSAPRWTKSAWAYRRPPEDPIERIEFRIKRAHIVLVFHVIRDLAALRMEAAGVPIPPPRRRALQRQYRALTRELAFAAGITRSLRVELRRQRQESSETAWLRRQLATLEVTR